MRGFLLWTSLHQSAQADLFRMWNSCKYPNIMISLCCALPAQNRCILESVIVFTLFLDNFQHTTDLPFMLSYSKIRTWLSRHLLHCAPLKSQLSRLFSNLFSPWLTFSSVPLQQMKEQSLNLLLSASHLDHKNSCLEHANQYPPIFCSAAQDSQQ